jgi:hypothetical protein
MINSVRQFGARRIVTAVLAIGLVGIVAVPVINATSTTPTAAAVGPGGSDGQVDDAPLNAAAVRLGGGLLNRVVRGDLVVRGKGGAFVNVHYERGRISAVDATSITIVGPDGHGATFALTTSTRIRSEGQPAKVSDLAVGRTALVFGTGTAGGYTAVLVREPQAKSAANPAPNASVTP